MSDEPVVLHKRKLIGFMNPCGNKEVGQVTVQRISADTTPDRSPLSSSKVTGWTRDRLFEQLKVDEMPLDGPERKRMEDILWRRRECFSKDEFDLGTCNFFEAKIKLKPDATPQYIPPIPIAYKHQDEMQKHLDGMERAGIIEEVDHNTSFWNSRVFLVAKPHQPGAFRFVADFRSLNSQTLPDTYQLPNIKHISDRIGGAKIFSVFDLSKSFFQVKYDQKSRPLTAFSVNGKKYIFQRMVMGHCNSSAQFSRMVDHLMANIPLDQLCYFLDDLCVASNDTASHMDRIDLVLGRLVSANLKLLPKKCNFLKSSVSFCGITLSENGQSINADRIEAVKKLQPPRTSKEGMEVMGFLSYNRPFVPGFAALAKPLYALIDMSNKKKKLNWTPVCQKNFEEIKRRIAEGVVLASPRVDGGDDQYTVIIDASKDGYGAELQQLQDGEHRTVAYFSKRVPKHVRMWSQSKLEFEGLVETLLHWALYLKGVRFLVKTDCLSLLSLERLFAKSDATMIRRLNKLADFRFSLQHIAGSANCTADFMSRYVYRRRDCDMGTQTDSLIGPGNAAHSDGNSTVLTTVNRLEVALQTDNSGNTAKTHDDRAAVDKIASSFLTDNGTAVETQTVQVINSHGTGAQPTVDEGIPHDSLVPEEFLVTDWGSTCSSTDRVWTDDDITELLTNNVSRDCICKQPDDVERLEMMEPTRVVQVVNTSADRTTLNGVADCLPQLLDLAEIVKNQRQDPVLNVVRGWVEAGEKPRTVQATRTPPELIILWKQFKLLTIRQDILCRKWIKRDRQTKEVEIERFLPIIPEVMREQVMNLYHSTRITAHPGVDETYRQCLAATYWPKMKDDVELFVQACVTCGRAKAPQAYLRAPLKHVIAHDRGDVLCIDHIVPEKEGMTPRRNRYILTLTDVFTGFVICLPTRTTNSEEVIRLILHHWILRPGFGTPKEIIADNASSFTSHYYETICKAFGVKSTHGTAYKCSSTAKVERTNRRINNGLRLMLTDRQLRDWDLYLDFVSAALNARRSRHTGFTSNYLMHGREIYNPLSLTVDNEPVNFEPGVKYSAKAYALYKTYRTILQKARKNAEADFRYADNWYNKHLQGPYFKEGEWCYTLVQCPAHKFSKRWRGPYRIGKAISEHLYVVELENGKDKLMNVSKLKPYKYNRYSPAHLNIDAPEFRPQEPITSNSCEEQESPEDGSSECEEAGLAIEIETVVPGHVDTTVPDGYTAPDRDETGPVPDGVDPQEEDEVWSDAASDLDLAPEEAADVIAAADQDEPPPLRRSGRLKKQVNPYQAGFAI